MRGRGPWKGGVVSEERRLDEPRGGKRRGCKRRVAELGEKEEGPGERVWSGKGAGTAAAIQLVCRTFEF